MVEQSEYDKKLLKEFRKARDKYQAARFAKQPLGDFREAYVGALHSLLMLEDESLRNIAEEAWQYFGRDNEFCHGEIAENMLAESIEPDSSSVN